MGLGQVRVDGQGALSELFGTLQMRRIRVAIAIGLPFDKCQTGEGGSIIGVRLERLLKRAPSRFHLFGLVGKLD